jgi:hypothetical protein
VNKYLEILIIKTEDRLSGLDCEEIDRVISMEKNDNDNKTILQFRERCKLFSISEILNSNSIYESKSYICTKMENGDDIMVAVQDIYGIIKIKITDILVLPEFIRKKQKPFFSWGFVQNENRLINLITFSYFNWG